MVPEPHEILAKRDRKVTEPRVVGCHPAQARLHTCGQAKEREQRLPPLTARTQAPTAQPPQGTFDGSHVVFVRAGSGQALGNRRQRPDLRHEIFDVVVPGETDRTLRGVRQSGLILPRCAERSWRACAEESKPRVLSHRHLSISKFLSLVLRHEPSTIGLTLDHGGWVSVSELLEALARHGQPLAAIALEAAILDSVSPAKAAH